MTYAEEVAIEHIAYRRAEGWTWGCIIAELQWCAGACDVRLPARIRNEAGITSALAKVWLVLREECRQGVAA